MAGPLLSDAAEHENEAHLLLAEMHSRKEDYVKWLEAANRIQLAYEKALVVEDRSVIKQCLEMSPKIISKLEAAIPAMSESVFQEFMATRFIFDKKRQPYPNRKKRQKYMTDLVVELMSIRGSGAEREASIIAELASNIRRPNTARKTHIKSASLLPVGSRVNTNNIGRNDPCPCGSGKKYKRCHAA